MAQTISLKATRFIQHRIGPPNGEAARGNRHGDPVTVAIWLRELFTVSPTADPTTVAPPTVTIMAMIVPVVTVIWAMIIPVVTVMATIIPVVVNYGTRIDRVRCFADWRHRSGESARHWS